jgi:glycosyltransferase involved in cell wall biosynthesis
VKNNKTTFSVIMPAYNAEKFIKQSIASVLSQTFKGFELIVVDDGSIDSTKKIVKSFKDKRIIYIYQKNQGVSAARNNAIKISKSDWLAFLDSDDVWIEDTLESFSEFIDGFDLIIGEYAYLGTKIDTPAYDLSGLKMDKKSIFNKLINGNFIGIGSLAFRKNIIDKYFDEKIKFAEDYKLWLKLVLKSEKIKIIDKVLYHYRVHELSALQNTDFKDLQLAKILSGFSIHSHAAKSKANEYYNNYIGHKISSLVQEGIKNYDFEDLEKYKINPKNKIKLTIYRSKPEILSRIGRSK